VKVLENPKERCLVVHITFFLIFFNLKYNMDAEKYWNH
jgi:ubiquitin C-terminal hydrolase